MYRRLAILMACLVAAGSVHALDFSYRVAEQPNHTILLSGFQRFARLKKDDETVRTRYNPTAGAVGYVYNQEWWHAGASFSYEHGDRKYDSGEGSYKVRANTPGFTLFGGWHNQNGLYAKGSTFLGFASYKFRDARFMNGAAGNGETNHNTLFGASLEVGKSFTFGDDWALTPHVGFDYAHAPSESYRFAGGDPLRWDSQNFYEIPIGLGLSKTFNCGNWSITPSVDMTLVNSLGHISDYNYYPGFASRTANDWKVYGVGGDHVGGRITTGIQAKIGERTSFGVDYTFEGRKGYRDHRISAMFGWAF